MPDQTDGPQAAAEPTHTIQLSELAWCDTHRDAADRRGVNPAFAALEFVERITDHELWPGVVTGGDLRIDFDAAPDPPIDITHTAGSDALEFTPLCCVLDADARETTFALTQHPK